ncbi:unnamed protein product [Ectocarpus sp. 12 AP-2014]
MRRLASVATSCLLLVSSAVVTSSESCSTVVASVSPSQASLQVDMADDTQDSGCPVKVTWETAGSTTEAIATEVLDVFIVLDESGSVGQDNYNVAIDFVRTFIEDLDSSAFMFGSGGQLGITEFSWNPTDKTGDHTRSECQANFPGRRCFGQQFVPFVTADYWIPQTGVFAYPNSYNISTDLPHALEVVNAMVYEPQAHDPQWPSYSQTCLGDAIKYTADMAQAVKNDQTRAALPDRQEIGGPHTGDFDPDDYVLDLEDFASLDDSFAGELVSRISIACANNVEIAVVVSTAAGVPTALECEGETCAAEGSTLTWNIAKLDDSLREMTYVIDGCDCASVGGFVETLASVSYTDSDNSPATHPTLPTSTAFDVVDPSETCGAPSVTVDTTGTWVDGNINGYTNVDESITFAFDITNSGTKTLHNFCLSASKLGAGCLECTSPTMLPQGSFFSCTVSYQATQDDLDLGVVVISATVSAESYYADGESVQGDTSTVVDLKTDESLHVLNQVAWTDADYDGFPDAGETLDYSITVTNVGTVTLEGVEVVGTSGAVLCHSDPQPVAKLAVGDSYECTMSHQITQAEINAGSVSNTATATASAPTAADGVTKATASTAILEHDAKILLVGQGTWEDQPNTPTVDYSDQSEIISYVFTVRNIGNVDLTAITVWDATIEDDCGVVAGLGAGVQYTCTGSYSLTWADINSGSKLTSAT